MTRAPGLLLRLYRSLSPALAGAARVAAPWSEKLGAGVTGRRGLMDRLLAGAGTVGGGVWFHATSVGEYEQARPLIAAIRTSRPDVPVAVTHFSPSGRDYAEKRPAGDLHDYLPFDTAGDMARLMAAWAPRLLVLIKFDCWPNHVLAADRAGVPVVLLAGSLQPRSARLHPLVRPLYRDVFDRFAHLGVCTGEDARRFRDDLGTGAPISVTGDTRVEQVILRWEDAAAGPVQERLRGLGGRILVLGSTWPPDEALWLPVLGELLSRHEDLRVVLTPHEPTPERLAGLERDLDARGVPHRRLSALMAGDDHPARVILVDSIGVLAEIYRSGHLAYVGGSFTTGVHNTMEPAVCSLPVMFGPRIRNAEEAGVLVRRDAGQVLNGPDEALAHASGLLADEDLRLRRGTAARAVVLDQRGATDRSMAVIAPWLDAPART
ncbi:MAG: hypothetical protein GY838_18350 [bacterium]|nr:hypothetical protein [bacterium]